MSIFFKYYHRKTALPGTCSLPLSPPKVWTRKLTSSEIVVFKKCLAISISFILLWGLQLVTIIIEFCTKQPLPPVYSSIIGVLLMLQSFLDPILIAYFDTNLKVEVYELVGYKRKSTSSMQEKTPIDGPVYGNNIVRIENAICLRTEKLEMD
jgi:hypothetical protein